MKWKIASLLVCFASLATGLAMTLTGCQFRVAKDPYEFVTSLGAEPDVLNPVLSTSAVEGEVETYLFDSLLTNDNQTLAFKPRLAKAWEISPDHLQYTFHLRDDVEWHDGKPFTADDVIFTFEKIQDPKIDAAVLRSYFRDVTRAEKLDDFTVRFTYRHPYFKAIYMLGGLQPLPKHLFPEKEEFNQHPFNRAPVGTGPYRFKEWKTGRHLMLERNESCWGDKPAIQKLTFKIIPESAVALQLSKKQELDFVELGPLQWSRQTDTPKFKKYFQKHRIDSPAGGYFFIAWNLRHRLFQDARVRTALAHLVDTQAVVDKLLFGLAKTTTGPNSSATKGYDHSLPVLRYDTEEAKLLLKEAGWADHDGDGWLDKEGVTFRFTLLYPAAGTFYEKFAPIFRENLQKVGIDMDLKRLEWVAFTREMDQRNFEALIGGWSGGWPTDNYQVWHSSQAERGSNYVGFQNDEADQLMETVRITFDEEKREALQRKIHKIIYEEQPCLFLFESISLLARHRRFQNVIEYPMGVDIKEWTINASVLE